MEWDLEVGKAGSYHWECHEKNEIYWASFHDFWKMLGSRYHNDVIWWDEFGLIWIQIGDYLNIWVDEVKKTTTLMNTFLEGDLLYSQHNHVNTPIQLNFVDATWEEKINKTHYSGKKKTEPAVGAELPAHKQPFQIISEIMGVVHQCLKNELLHKLSDAAARGLMLDLD